MCAPTERARKENCSCVLTLEFEEGFPKRRPYNRPSLPLYDFLKLLNKVVHRTVGGRLCRNQFPCPGAWKLLTVRYFLNESFKRGCGVCVAIFDQNWRFYTHQIVSTNFTKSTLQFVSRKDFFDVNLVLRLSSFSSCSSLW